MELRKEPMGVAEANLEIERRGLKPLEGLGEVIALDIVDADSPHDVELFLLLYTLSDESGVDLVGHGLEGLHHFLLHEARVNVPYHAHVQLHIVWLELDDLVET